MAPSCRLAFIGNSMRSEMILPSSMARYAKARVKCARSVKTGAICWTPFARRYGELFSTMHNVCDRWQRRNESFAIELGEVHNALEAKEVERIALTEHATKCEREVDAARRRHQADCERATSITQRARQREKS